MPNSFIISIWKHHLITNILLVTLKNFRLIKYKKMYKYL